MKNLENLSDEQYAVQTPNIYVLSIQVFPEILPVRFFSQGVTNKSLYQESFIYRGHLCPGCCLGGSRDPTKTQRWRYYSMKAALP